MATIEKWPDGYILDMDSRREDPLFYYRQEDDWVEVVGFQVEPLYEEREAERVEISVFADHRKREIGLAESKREEIYVRVVPSLVARHERWNHVRLTGTDLEVVLRSGSLSYEMTQLGFERQSTEGRDDALWSRSRPTTEPAAVLTRTMDDDG